MGTVVIGKIESGQVNKGQTVMIMPNKVILIPNFLENGRGIDYTSGR